MYLINETLKIIAKCCFCKIPVVNVINFTISLILLNFIIHITDYWPCLLSVIHIMNIDYNFKPYALLSCLFEI